MVSGGKKEGVVLDGEGWVAVVLSGEVGWWWCQVKRVKYRWCQAKRTGARKKKIWESADVEGNSRLV